MTPPSIPTPRGMLDDLADLSSDPHASECDALADLFLGDGALVDRAPLQPPPAPRREVPRQATPALTPSATGAPTHALAAPLDVQLLILGHLPVMASAWVIPAASTIAERLGGPVALIRQQEGSLTIELVAPAAAPGEHAAPAADLATALARARRHAKAWILRVDDLSEVSLAAMPGVSRLVLLTGPDEPALIAAYRAMKNLSQGSGGSRWQVILVGTDAARADHAAARLVSAARSFLGEEIDPPLRLTAISSSHVTTIFRGPATAEAAELLTRLRTTLAERTVEVAPPAIAPAASRIGPRQTTSTASPGQTPPSARATVSDASPDQASPDGLSSLGRLCPFAPDVDLMKDHDGALHLVAFVPSVNSRPDSGGTCVTQLLAAAAWARDHASLLTRLDSALRSVDAPVLHVVTPRPAELRRMLDTGIKVHARVEIVVAGRRHAALVAVNDPTLAPA